MEHEPTTFQLYTIVENLRLETLASCTGSSVWAESVPTVSYAYVHGKRANVASESTSTGSPDHAED